jgi:hypothetical protein
MQSRKAAMLTMALVLAIAMAAASLILGCLADGTTSGTAEATEAPSGAQLWAAKCGQCHNFRPPQEYNDEQWAAAVHHMRTRVPMTGQEQRAITKYLQSVN